MRVLFAAQTGVAPPTFVLFTNVAASLHFSYVRYLTNRLREEYRLRGLADPPPRAPPRAEPQRGRRAPDPACYTPEFRGSGLCGTCGRHVYGRSEARAPQGRGRLSDCPGAALCTAHWEAEFPDLGQQTASGPRIYGRADVERVLRIRELVYVEGLTLAGARRRLEESGAEDTSTSADDFVWSTSRRERGFATCGRDCRACSNC